MTKPKWISPLIPLLSLSEILRKVVNLGTLLRFTNLLTHKGNHTQTSVTLRCLMNGGGLLIFHLDSDPPELIKISHLLFLSNYLNTLPQKCKNKRNLWCLCVLEIFTGNWNCVLYWRVHCNVFSFLNNRKCPI